MKKLGLVLSGLLLGANLYALNISTDTSALETANQNQTIPDNTVEEDSWSTFNNHKSIFNSAGEENSKSVNNNGIGNGLNNAAGKSGVNGKHVGAGGLK